MFATYLLPNYLYFLVFGCANLFKLASAREFAETDQKSQHEQDASRDASRCWARRPGRPNRDANYILSSMQTDQDRSFASTGCVGPLEMPLTTRSSVRAAFSPIISPKAVHAS
jgi:hypothetical protein